MTKSLRFVATMATTMPRDAAVAAVARAIKAIDEQYSLPMRVTINPVMIVQNGAGLVGLQLSDTKVLAFGDEDTWRKAVKHFTNAVKVLLQSEVALLEFFECDFEELRY